MSVGVAVGQKEVEGKEVLQTITLVLVYDIQEKTKKFIYTCVQDK